MKRCPQCEFIYEDDQSLCDMDGVLLVFDSRTLPNFHALATVPAVPGKTAARRNRMVPAFATILLTVVIASFYYLSAQRPAAAPAENFSPPPVSAVEAPVTVPPKPTPEPAKPEAETQPTSPAPKPAVAPPPKKATAKPAAVKPAEPKKEDSKVGSILKKTGRILKKPFKF